MGQGVREVWGVREQGRGTLVKFQVWVREQGRGRER